MNSEPDDEVPIAGVGPANSIMPYKDPEARRTYDAAYKQLRRGGSPALSNPLVPPEVRLQTARDVLELLGEQVNAVQAAPDADPLEKARVVGFLAGVALRAIEAGDQQARLEAVERVLKLRSAEAREGGRNGRH